MAPTSAQARTQRRGKETKRRLIQETKCLLAEYDFQSLTLDQIASAVGVAKSSILWHFGSKEALLTEAVFDLFEEISEKLNFDKPKLATVDERIRHMLESVAEYYIHNPDAKGIAITLLFDRQVSNAIHERIRQQWHEHREEIRDFVSSDEDPISETKAMALMGLMHGCYLQWHLNGCSGDLKQDLVAAYESLKLGPVNTT